ncbi:MAG TPA: hypothetical protein VJV78_08645 [Polyangiales bacterium]|nr:hypothetical protein [Polyangiales bacterium]
MPLVRYLARLNIAQRVLWCYLIWYLEVLARYFDPNPRLWLSSAGISAIIGTGLYLSTVHASEQKTALAGWQVARLYMMPLCVSSFAALIKDRGFVLVFHPGKAANLHAAAACATFLGVAWLARAFSSPQRLAPSRS